MMSRTFTAVVVAAIAASSLTHAYSPVVDGGFRMVSGVNNKEMTTISVGLHLQNKEALFAFVNEVSDPTSPNYAQYLSLSELTEKFGPSASTLNTVMEFFAAHGGAVVPSRSRDHLTVTLSVGDLSALTGGATFAFYAHTTSGRRILRTLDAVNWQFPSEVASAIEIISGVSDFLDSNKERKDVKTARAAAAVADFVADSNAPEILRCVGAENQMTVSLRLVCKDGSFATFGKCASDPQIDSVSLNAAPWGFLPIDATFKIDELMQDGLAMNTPVIIIPKFSRINVTATVAYSDGTTSIPGEFVTAWSPSIWVNRRIIHEMYGIPAGTYGTNPKNSIAVGSFEKQYYSNDDLRMFAHDSGIPFVEPTVIGYDNQTAAAAGGEAELDIQMISGVAAGVPATFWSVSGPGPAHGDQAYVLTWAYLVGNDTNPPLVTSLSYGDTELGYFNKFGDFSYINRMNTELAKMAARGLTVVAGSGDAGTTNVGEGGNDISGIDPDCSHCRPFFPSNSPYVTSLSASFFSTNSVPVTTQTMAGIPVNLGQVGEVAVGVSAGIRWTTGGGFSNLTMRATNATWQNDAVNAYLAANKASLPPASFFNSAGRGYPDVAVVGHNLLCRWKLNLQAIDGTSASGPIMAGLIALLNEARLNAGKAPMGLLNPFLYSSAKTHPSAFNDIVMGANRDGDLQARGSPYPTFCNMGFEAVPNWDPVTGLGSPNMNVLIDLALAA